jgi:nucleoside-diphosphate-sugar epimerase
MLMGLLVAKPYQFPRTLMDVLTLKQEGWEAKTELKEGIKRPISGF